MQEAEGQVSNRAVWKFRIPLTNNPGDVVPLTLPKGARLLKIGTQGSNPVEGPAFWVWALVDPEEKEKETREVLTAGTGHQIPQASLDRVHQRDIFPPLGRKTLQETILALDGRLVVHIWISQPVTVPVEST